MTISRLFYDWQRLGPPMALPAGCSPNLQVIRREFVVRRGMASLGCRDAAATSDSGGISTHRWAALDLSTLPLTRSEVVDWLCPFIVGWSEELGVQALHDYVGQRIWRAGRTNDVREACNAWWRAQPKSKSGMGQPWATWIHLEVRPDRWFDNRSFADRGIF